ncbi:hypothetical protein M3Y97_00409600 [Aphelenchoides bicaudatus]|nr:hypothetical protein M3Y97_00409600 [Aphelenchoides bicaudatus]
MLFLYKNDHHNLFNFGGCLARTEKPKNKSTAPVEALPSTSKCQKPSGPRLRTEAMSLLLEFCLRKSGTPSSVYGRECLTPKVKNLRKIMLLNQKSMLATRYAFLSMRVEVYLPAEANPYPQKRQPGHFLMYRQTKNTSQVLRISFGYEMLNFFCRLNFIRMPIQRLHVESYTKKARIEQFVTQFGECVEELVWKSGDIQRVLKFISACASKLRYLECDINLLDSPEFPRLKLNQFKSIKVKANSDHVVTSLLLQEVKHVDLCDLTTSDGSSFAQSLLRPTLTMIPQNSLESASLRLQVCQANELLAKVTAIKQFAPNLKQVEFVRNISGIEFDSDLSQFLFLEIEQIHDAVKSAQIKDIELSVRCVYSLQPEECFNFRASASLSVVCNLENAELTWRPPRAGSGGKQMFRRQEQMTFKDSTKSFRASVHKFVSQMEKDYRTAECY